MELSDVTLVIPSLDPDEKLQATVLAAINEVLADLGEDGVNDLVMKHMGLE